ncbi:MAG: RimK family alpha-L-glutamate ligase [Pseudomonadota bacterium]
MPRPPGRQVAVEVHDKASGPRAAPRADRIARSHRLPGTRMASSRIGTMLRFGVISAYPREDWHSQQIVEACAARGSVEVHAPTAFSIRTGFKGAVILATQRDVREWDVWLTPRALGEQGDHEFQCMVYSAISELGIPVVNPVSALLDALDKARCSWLLARAGIPTPSTIAVQSLEEAEMVLRELRVAVAKPIYGSLGKGVVRLTRWDRSVRASLQSQLRQHGLVYLQRFVRTLGRQRDLRLFVVGGRVVGAIERLGVKGEFRTNIHQGANARPYQPSAVLSELAVRATETVGLEYAGVDVIEAESAGPVVIEVNGTPQWQGILRATGSNMAEEIVGHAAWLARNRTRNRRRKNG